MRILGSPKLLANDRIAPTKVEVSSPQALISVCYTVYKPRCRITRLQNIVSNYHTRFKKSPAYGRGLKPIFLVKIASIAGGKRRIILPFSLSTVTNVTLAVTYNSLPSKD